ncbi:ATP-binding protein [Amycolatopsis sp. cmx-11-12]|uniref:ATP-binding protein n=1 Tax=Amycolatopsis sp. cmx-11-12 TaxID=2785795 RepID=UPI0039183391
MIEWSYDLCSESEQLVLARASVFSGGFVLAAAEEVCAGDSVEAEDMLDLVHELIDKSLLVSAEETGGELCYRMLETVREYAAERLAELGGTERVARLHRDWYAKFAARYAEGWIGPDQVEWLRRVAREHANLRGALDCCATTPGEGVAGLRMVTRLGVCWSVCGLLNEARTWLVKQMAAAPPDTPEWASGLLLRVWYDVLGGDIDAAAADTRASEELVRTLPDEVTQAYGETIRATAALYFEDGPVHGFDSARQVFRQHGIRTAEVYAEVHHRQATAFNGDPDTARALLAVSIAAAEEVGEPVLAIMGLAGAERHRRNPR